MANKGILGRKLGMTQVFDDANRVVPVTVIEAGPCRVVQLKTPERDGYAAVQLAFGGTKPARLSKPELGHLKAANADPAKYLAELRVDDLSGFEIGQVLKADVFAAGERVDITGISKGHGFSGVMKRHNFSGQGASHGNHKKHRAPHWRGGGVAHGPKPRDYSQRTPKKMVKLALRSALSDRASDGKLMVVDEWGIDAPRTKDGVKLLETLGFRTKGARAPRVLLVLFRTEEAVWKSFRN